MSNNLLFCGKYFKIVGICLIFFKDDIDVEVDDELLVHGGMVRFEVVEKFGLDVKCLCTDSGLLLPHANLAL